MAYCQAPVSFPPGSRSLAHLPRALPSKTQQAQQRPEGWPHSYLVRCFLQCLTSRWNSLSGKYSAPDPTRIKKREKATRMGLQMPSSQGPKEPSTILTLATLDPANLTQMFCSQCQAHRASQSSCRDRSGPGPTEGRVKKCHLLILSHAVHSSSAGWSEACFGAN